ncbi:DNA translocase FtsK 4TM domain-containing protein [Nannocystaceae bacterium ST9]
MAKSKTSRRPEAAEPGIPRGWGEFLGVALLAIGALMFGGLASFQFGDGTLMGPVGRLVAAALYAGFGMASYLIVLGVVGIGVKALLGHRMELQLGEGLGFSAATLAGCVLLHVMFPAYRVHAFTAGGLSGELLGEVSLGLFDHAGTYLLTIAIICLGLLASTPLSTAHLVGAARWVASGTVWVLRYLWSGVLGVVQAQRELADRKAGDAEAADEEGEDEGEDEEGDDEAEQEEAEEDEAEEEVEEEVEEEAAEEQVPTTPARRARKPKAAKPEPESARKPRKNRKRGQSEGDESESDEPASAPAPAPALALAPTPVVEPSEPEPDKSEERPEIILNEDPDFDVEGESSVGESEEGSEAGDDPKRKKAPLTPAELAARARAKQAEAAAVASASKPKPSGRVEGAQPVAYLHGSYELPPAQLFAAVEKAKAKTKIDTDFIYEQAERIVEAFAQFKIRGKVTKIHPGPVITRYEFKPEAGVKVSRIQNLENDLAMALEALRIRILAPIPGKSTVGLEVPNAERETVYLQENLTDPSFSEGDPKLPLVLGKDIVGKCVSIDLGKAPHLLVAGATGSGKSVGVNGMLCSLLYACTPEQLRLILIDPKMLEFSVYKDIPHLLLPVITDAEKANLALRWAVNEMERRYAMLSEAGVRDINGYNKKLPQLQAEWDGESKALAAEADELAAEARLDGEDSVNGAMLSGVQFDAMGNAIAITGGVALPARPESLPYIVIVIDEFADLMMVASKEVESNVARLAAKARAAGVHLILATQRPSVDVITGTIKNNFPSRIAFQVTSDIDSRTILDQKGAKQLLGMGDMLYMDRGKEPRRVHGCFVSETEIERVVDFVRKQARPAYNMDITRRDEDEPAAGEAEDKIFDPLYDKAVQIVAETQKVSTSMLQRRLNVGYNRAAKIVERMEEEGAIGPANGAKPREVFVSAA